MWQGLRKFASQHEETNDTTSGLHGNFIEDLFKTVMFGYFWSLQGISATSITISPGDVIVFKWLITASKGCSSLYTLAEFSCIPLFMILYNLLGLLLDIYLVIFIWVPDKQLAFYFAIGMCVLSYIL